MRIATCRPLLAALAVAPLVLLLVALPAPAVIVALVPLKAVIEGEEMAFVATVDAVEPTRPSVVFKLEKKLKGDAPFDRLPVNLTGDAEAKKDNHTKVMLDRLEPGRKLVIFATNKDTKYSAFGYLEGTWFQMQGTPADDGKTVRWAFLHCEPYLRRTFKGTTAEMVSTVEAWLTVKTPPPGVNAKEKPGYGPPVEKKCGMRNAECGIETPATGIHSPLTTHHSPLFAVINPLVLAPLGILAALFPGVAARMAIALKRWRAFLVIASLNSTLALLLFFAKKYTTLPDWWVFSNTGFTVLMLVSTAVGLCWAGRRYRRMCGEDPATSCTPTRREVYTLTGLTLLVALILGVLRIWYPWEALVAAPMRDFTFIGFGLLAATGYALYRHATRRSDRLPDGTDPAVRLSLSGELVGLGTLFLCGLSVIALAGRHSGGVVGTQAGDAEDHFGPKLASIDTFRVEDADQVWSGVTVSGDRLYFGAGRTKGLSTVLGYVFCLDRHTGRVVKRFGGENVKQVFCTPTVADGRVYVGEGLHTDSKCKLYCLDAATLEPVWKKPIETTSHTEGSPRLVNGKVFFTAGDDGLLWADAATGENKQQFAGKAQGLHIDGSPAVAGNRVFIGSGLYTTALVCVNADTGKEVWRTPVNLRSFGTPLVLGNRVVYGLGTGNLLADTVKYDEESDRPEEPAAAGAVVCVNADNGKVVWRYDLSKSVHTPPAADAFSVFVTSRDGFVHCLDRRTGKLRWKTGMGSPITSGAAVAASGGVAVAVYAVSREGLMACLDPRTGRIAWQRPLPGFTWMDDLGETGIISTPAVVTTETPTGSRRTVYVGGMLVTRNTGQKTCAVFRIEDEISND